MILNNCFSLVDYSFSGVVQSRHKNRSCQFSAEIPIFWLVSNIVNINFVANVTKIPTN